LAGDNMEKAQVFYSTLPRLAEVDVLVVGRCFSATHEAHASCRSMAQCMAMGQAAGTAAALCIEQRVDPRDLDVASLQARLVENGAIIYDEQQTKAA